MNERTDTERLDWLHEYLMEIVAMTDAKGQNAFWTIEWWCERDDAYREITNGSPDIRQAIDAAMDAEAGDG